MHLDIVAISVSFVSFIAALFALKTSFRRYELQQDQFGLQKKEFDEKFKLQLHIKGEHFLTSHRLEP